MKHPLILALALAIQSSPGLRVASCAMMGGEMGEACSASAGPALPCSCCMGGAEEAGMPAAEEDACCCGEPEQDEPRAPARESRNSPVESLWTAPPVIIGILPLGGEASRVGWVVRDPVPHRPANSIQSLLCVWMI